MDRSEGGLGIGLSVVARLVNMHGGTVTASSPGPGEGATFEIRLPKHVMGLSDATVAADDQGSEAPSSS
jgi:two-component system, sensor histidine kinase